MVLKGVVGSPEVGAEGEEQFYTMSALLSSKLSPRNDIEDVPSRVITAITDPTTPACAEITLAIMGACHSLLVAPETGAVVGDPLETATMDSSGFQFVRYLFVSYK